MQPVQDINIGGRLTATQYQYTMTDIDLTELNKWGPIVQNALSKLPEIIDLASDQQSAAPQLSLVINRDVASRLGITAADIDSVLYDAFGQRPISQLYTSLNEYYVIMEVNPGFQLGPDAVRDRPGQPDADIGGVKSAPSRTMNTFCPLPSLTLP